MIILGMVRPSDGKKIISYPVFRVDDLRRAPVLGLVVWLVVVVPLGVVGRLLLLVGLPRPAVLQLLLLLLELGHLRLRLGDLPVDLSDLLEKVVLGGAQLVPLVDGGLGARGGDLLNLGVVARLLEGKKRENVVKKVMIKLVEHKGFGNKLIFLTYVFQMKYRYMAIKL